MLPYLVNICILESKLSYSTIIFYRINIDPSHTAALRNGSQRLRIASRQWKSSSYGVSTESACSAVLCYA